MHCIIPELITKNYRAGCYQGSLRAASLFLDISGFSSITDALMGQGRDGAEALAVTMRAVFDPLVEAIFGQGGMIVGYAGDSISALYPAEADEASAVRRALASAHAIQIGLATQPLFETPYGAFQVSAKIGLAIGDASWGILRSRRGDRAVYYFRGDAVEEAARAEHCACAGDTILTNPIRQRLGAAIATEPLMGFHLLGKVLGDLPPTRLITAPVVDPAVASIFAPREVVAQDLHGEFRQTVPLFMRIPDLPDGELQQFMQTVFDLQERYGGLIDRIDFGDKGCILNVVWGVPVAHENDIDRALSFALDLRAGVDFPVSAGITYYISYAGYVGGQLFETYTAYGWGMNLAARLMMSASENDIWLDERVCLRIRQRFHCESAGEQAFKGFAQRQKVYVLRGRKSGSDALFWGKIAGRETELQELVDFTNPIWNGKFAGVTGIWGEGGIGKSRLVYEFRRSPALQGRKCLWAVCQADEILHRSFDPFRHWLIRYFEILPAEGQEIGVKKLLDKLDRLLLSTENDALAAELKRAHPYLAALVQLEWPDAAYEQQDAQGRYDNTILALISLLKAESLRQPLILFLEDAQYLDSDSKAFLPRLKRALAADPVSYPVAILMAARWQALNAYLDEGLVDQEIHLAALSDEAISSLCDDFLGGPAAQALVKLVNQRAEGNPFFVEQILRYLREQNQLEVSRSGEWILRTSGRASMLPADISAMLVARLDQLTGPVKDVIQAASVLGRVFDVPVLKLMLSNGSSLRNGIVAAEQAGIWSPLSESRYIFNHSLLRDVAYNMQLQSRRRELHALAYDAIRDCIGNEVNRHYAELAYHSEQAALEQEAHRCLSLAGDAARDEYQNAQALDFYRRALAFVSGTDLKEQYRLHRECEKVLAELGRHEEWAKEIEALQTLADAMREPGNLAEVMLLRSRLVSSTGDYDRAAELALQAKQLAIETDLQDTAIEAYRSLLDASYQRGRYQEAIDYGEAGIALARKQNARQEEASILNILGLAVLEMKNPSTARAYFEQGLSIFRAEDNLRGVARVLANFGTVAGYQGNYSSALDYYEQSMRLAREIGSRKGECIVLAGTGWIAGLLGQYDKASAYAERYLQLAREIGDRYAETLALVNLSSHAGAKGQFASAIEYAQQGLSLARECGDRNLQAWALTYLGHGLFDSGTRGAALKAYQEALELRYELDQPSLATEPAAGLARIFLLDGDPPSAKRHVDTILAQLDEDGTLEGTDQPLRVYLSCYYVLSNMNDPQAKGILNTAHDMLRTRANGITDPSGRKVFLENIPYNREILSLWEKNHQSGRLISSQVPDRRN